MWAGLLDSKSAKSLLAELSERRRKELETARAAFEFDRKNLETRIDSLHSTRAEAVRSQEELKGKRASKSKELGDLKRRAVDLRTNVGLSTATLFSRRSRYPIRLLALKTEDRGRVTRELGATIVAKEQQRLEFEKALHDLSLERRKLNEKEYERRVRLLDERRSKAEERYRELNNYLATLRRLGMTRTTAGFLVWAGYLSFAAFGWFLGETLQKIYGDDHGTLHALVKLTTGAINAIVLSLGALRAIPVLLLSPIMLLLVIFGVFFVADTALRYFDGAWRSKRGGGARSTERDNLPWNWLHSPTRGLFRADYTQFLARLPLVYVWLLAPILVGLLSVATELSNPPGQPPSLVSLPWQSVLYTYFAVTLCVVVAGFVLLYCMHIVEPRRRAAYATPTTLTFGRILYTNIEIAILAVGFIVIHLLAELFDEPFLRLAKPWDAERTVTLLFLVLLAGFVVSYGLIYRGLFKDYVNAKTEVQDYEDQIDKYGAYPAIAIEDFERERYHEELKRLEHEIERRWDQADFWGTPIHGLQMIRSPEALSWISRIVRGFPSAHVGFPSYINADSVLEPELVVEINRLMGDLAITEEMARQLEEELGELNTLEIRLGSSALDADVQRLLSAKLAREAQYEEAVTQIEQRYAEALVSSENGYQLGSFIRTEMAKSKGRV